MPLALLADLIRQAVSKQWNLQFVYPAYALPEAYVSLMASVPHKDIVPATSHLQGDCVVLNGWDDMGSIPSDSYCVLRTSLSDFCLSVAKLDALLGVCKRLDIVFTDEEAFSEEDVEPYKDALYKLQMLVLKHWKQSNRVGVNILTDRLFLTQMSNCDAGCRTVTLAPNGRFYICSSFYYTDEEDSCGSLEKGIDIKNPLLYRLNHAPLCSSCTAYHCQRCVYMNKKKTLEVNVPSFEQCRKAELELQATKAFYTLWQNNASIRDF
ncbi:MAG: CXXX repeat peptide maturase, partial [Prevotella sp.]|nr:CXXX repeat peptide maturase [Prevotella sp.]